MLSRKSQTKQQRRRSRRSIFCQNPPSPSLVSAALFLKDAPTPMWVPCQGKIYKNGYFRYLYNGKVGTVGPRYYRLYPDTNEAQLTENIKTLNLSTLKNRNPGTLKGVRRVWFDDYYIAPEPILDPIVMPGDETPEEMIPVIDTTLVANATPAATTEGIPDEPGFVIEPPVAPRPRQFNRFVRVIGERVRHRNG